jgi:hypothetical protein
MKKYSTAQLNIAHAFAGMKTAEVHGFASCPERFSACADQSPGLVWRCLQDHVDSGDKGASDNPLGGK